ncbi:MULTISPECIES: response regulator transcription factor [unclassified Streptomyces]|uniref:helix-turn-helix transcriptional regulator n=1 Tax=unclassified Streptomyces TaxID=2593676 RepID=UPI0036EE5B4B
MTESELFECAEVESAGCARIVLATPPQWRKLDARNFSQEHRPFVVLVGDEIQSRGINLHGDVPCDGVISLADASAASMKALLHRVVSGEFPMPAKLARQLLATGHGRVLGASAGTVDAFTAREQETLELLARGFSNKQIAKALAISPHGVKRLVGAVMLKLGAPNRTTAVIIAINEGFV